VLGLVISSGVKVLVLAVIVGIGSTIFGEFTAGFTGEPTIGDAMSVVLGALSLLALGIFGPGIANGIVSGGPQLGAGAAVGAGIAAGGVVAGGLAGAKLAGGAVASTARGASAVAGGASTAFQIGAASGSSTAGKAASGMAAVGQAGINTAVSPLKRAVGDSYRSGSRAAFEATGGKFSNTPTAAGPVANSNVGPPAWARRMKRQQSLHHGTAMAAHAIRSGDGGGAGTAISLSERS
ncbi:MAG: type IV secretion system protein, partial [Pseudomonadota bacterium]